jgi:hypothetical protein
MSASLFTEIRIYLVNVAVATGTNPPSVEQPLVSPDDVVVTISRLRHDASNE